MTIDFFSQEVKRSSRFVFKKMEQESVLVELTDNVVNMDKVYTLNELGTFIYSLLTQKQTVANLLDKVLEEFDVTREEAQTDLQQFLDHAEKMGIIEFTQR